MSVASQLFVKKLVSEKKKYAKRIKEKKWAGPPARISPPRSRLRRCLLLHLAPLRTLYPSLSHPLIDAPMPIYTSALALTPINYLASLSQGKHGGVEGEQPPVAAAAAAAAALSINSS